MSKKLLKQSSLYSLSHLFASITGLITFPLLTKNLTIEEYGAVGLFTISTSLLTSINKLGIQQSIIRFHSEVSNKKLQSSIIFPGMLMILLSSGLIYLLGNLLGGYSSSVLFDRYPLLIIAVSAALQSIRSLIDNLLIANQYSLSTTLFGLMHRVFSLSLIVIILLYISKSPEGFITAILIADALITIAIITWCFREKILYKFEFVSFDKGFFFSALAFSTPLFANEILNMVHAFIDRYFIEFYVSREALGIYSASANMATIICGTLTGGIMVAIVPMYLKVWREEGAEKTKELLNSVNDLYLLLTPAIITGIYLVAPSLLEMLSTKEYAGYAHLLPITALGMLLYSTNAIYGAGLQIKKKSKKIFRFAIESTVLNIVLNYIFIPMYGIEAAAIITVISYLWMVLRIFNESQKVIHITFDYFRLLRSIFYCTIMVVTCLSVESDNNLLEFVSRTMLGLLIYVSLILVFERSLRRKVAHYLSLKINTIRGL